MIIFGTVLAYIIVICVVVFLCLKIYAANKIIKSQIEFINNFDKELYNDLRAVQLKALEISRLADKYTKGKNSLLGDIIYAFLIALLPFKKLKGILYLHKLSKKIL